MQTFRCEGSRERAQAPRTALLLLLGALLITMLKGTDVARADQIGPPTGQNVSMPNNQIPPRIGGAPHLGVALSGMPGTWSDATSYTYQWMRCGVLVSGDPCQNIPGATSTTYTPVAADVDHGLQLQETATGPGGSVSALSATTPLVPGVAPSAGSAPSIDGTPTRGATLVANGTFTGIPTPIYTRQWERCTGGGSACVPILGATGSSYVLAAADVDQQIRVAVTATNSSGTLMLRSPLTATVAGPLLLDEEPTIAGATREAGTLTAQAGVWEGSAPITYAYQWLHCSSGLLADCSPIAGATGAQYVAAVADVNARVRVRVTATNPVGSLIATSAASAIITARPPVNTLVPTITGTVRRGEALAANNGVWDGTAPIAFERQWSRCTSDSCTPIASATGAIYTVSSADVDHTLQLEVRATNQGGSVSGLSVRTVAVPAIAPTSTSAPTISGVARDGRTLTARDGEFDAAPAATITRIWERCEGSTCTSIADATDPTYTAGADDVGHTIRLRVRASNIAGDTTVVSDPTTLVLARAPRSIAAPRISAPLADVIAGTSTRTVRAGTALSVDQDVWEGTRTLAYTISWRRCQTPAGTDCQAISDADGRRYTTTTADGGSAIAVEVVAMNAAGEAHATSEPVVVQAPARVEAPIASPSPAPAARAALRLRLAQPRTSCRMLIERTIAIRGPLRTRGALKDGAQVLAGRDRLLQVAVDGERVRLTTPGHAPITVGETSGLRWTARTRSRMALRSLDGRLDVAVARNASRPTRATLRGRMCTTSAPTLRRLLGRAGRPLRATVYVTDAAGVAVPGVTLKVTAGSVRKQVRTNRVGSVQLHLGAGGRRILHVEYAGDGTHAPAALDVPIRAAATTTVRLLSKSVRSGELATFAGTLSGNDGNPAGTTVALAYRGPRGDWRPAGLAHADRHGRWRVVTRPTLPRGAARVLVRARITPSARFPYEPAAITPATFALAAQPKRGGAA